MRSADVIREALDNIRRLVADVADGASVDELTVRPNGTGNSPAWLLWHLTRVQDHHVAELAGGEQAWTAQGFADRFDLPFAASATGYGHTSEEVARVRVPAPELVAYHDAVHARSLDFLATLSDADFDRVIDRSWDPPVTLGVRLISVLTDDLQHVGQAAYVRGLTSGTRGRARVGVQDEAVQALIDERAIREVLLRYCRAVDRCDAELLRSCYHEDARDEHGDFVGGRDEFVAYAIGALRSRAAEHGQVTTHLTGNVLIDLDGRFADCESYIRASHAEDRPDHFRVFEFNGRYID
ncbi:MAG: nuclear transport factor 2 family protein, partial [Actinobacteria bacterium]|nr:nuclear transport factor 2 family protein [Actinomycetota bacterium]